MYFFLTQIVFIFLIEAMAIIFGRMYVRTHIRPLLAHRKLATAICLGMTHRSKWNNTTHGAERGFLEWIFVLCLLIEK